LRSLDKWVVEMFSTETGGEAAVVVTESTESGCCFLWNETRTR
jgi:hypothetical protein